MSSTHDGFGYTFILIKGVDKITNTKYCDIFLFYEENMLLNVQLFLSFPYYVLVTFYLAQKIKAQAHQ